MDLREAAAARAAHLQRADRPRQRSASSMRLDKSVRAAARLEIRAASPEMPEGPITFHGIASTTESPYEMYDFWGPYQEVIAAGSFAETLGSNPDVPLVLQHDSLRRIASTVNGTLILSETSDGLDVLAPNLDPDDHDVRYIVPKIRSGLISEMSFAFTINAAQWSPDFTELRITSVDINRGDVAIVGFGANPATTAELRSRDINNLIRDMGEGDLRRTEAQLRMRLREFGQAPAMTREEFAVATDRLQK